MIVLSTQTLVPAAAAEPATSDLHAAIAAKAPPALSWQGNNGITIRMTSGEPRQVSGQCHARRPVVVLDGGAANAVECAAGRYTARLRSAAREEVIATQILPDGTIVAARLDQYSAAAAGQRATPGQLAKVLASARPGDRIVVEPGTYADVILNLAQGGGAAGRPVVIDGNNAVTFTGATRIAVGTAHVVLRGFTFRDVGTEAVAVTAPMCALLNQIL